MARGRSAKGAGFSGKRQRPSSDSGREDLRLKKRNIATQVAPQLTRPKVKRLSKREKKRQVRDLYDFPGLKDQISTEARNLIAGEGLLMFKSNSESFPPPFKRETTGNLEKAEEPEISEPTTSAALDQNIKDSNYSKDAEYINLDSESDSELGQQFMRFEQTSLAPWLDTTDSKDFFKYESCGEQMSSELLNYLQYMSPQESEASRRESCINRLRRVVCQLWPSAQVSVFGSHATGMYLPDADIDVVILCDEMRVKIRQEMHRLAARLKSNRLTDSVVVIAHARVPIIKYVEQGSQISVDIAFGQTGGLETASLVSSWLCELPILKPMGMFVRHFLKRRKLGDVANGGLGGYAMICMMYSRLKYLESSKAVTFTGKNDLANCGLFLLDFFDFYGNQFDNTSSAVKCQPPFRPIAKRSNGDMLTPQASGLAVEDPQNKTNNISKASYNYPAVKRGFQNAADSLKVGCLEWQSKSQTKSFLAPLLKFSGDEPLRTKVRLDLALNIVPFINSAVPLADPCQKMPAKNGSVTKSQLKKSNVQEKKAKSQNGKVVNHKERMTEVENIKQKSSITQKDMDQRNRKEKSISKEEAEKRQQRQLRFGNGVAQFDPWKLSESNKELSKTDKISEQETSYEEERQLERDENKRKRNSSGDDDDDSRTKLTSAERRQFWKRKAGTPIKEDTQKPQTEN